MVCNRAIRNLIREAKYNQLYSSIQTGTDEGMITMETSIAHLLESELIDYETAAGAVPDIGDTIGKSRMRK